ncbi:lymphocyte cytosolic protein 2 isoform X2 [Acanthopagrus latus]|uniref:lymphocyte cytosolic protein 2 isoform X2 n=1 Tax=Acanthopagrus latus TaxID=8177 RepID=UPI00187CB779|nr:lymphocyte cytosolic protein 2 isoform X2 [Acanthopagrus latus]
MSLSNVPSKVEVMGWNPQNLADYMRRLKLSGCDKAVMKAGITGAQFTQMTECDLQVFPSLYISLITKIQSDINKGEQKRGFGLKSKTQKYLKQGKEDSGLNMTLTSLSHVSLAPILLFFTAPLPPVFVQEEEDWNSDEFEWGDNSYTCQPNQTQTAEQQDSDEASDEDYEQPASEDTMMPPQPPREAKLHDRHYRDPAPEPPAAERASKPPPNPPRINPALPRPFKAAASQPSLNTDRSKKPGQPDSSQKDFKKSKGSAVKAPGLSNKKSLLPRPPKPTDVFNRGSKLCPPPPAPEECAMVKTSVLGPRGGLDPGWYGGNVTRHQAEVSLREMNKDGAFLVRDSSRGLDEHPYTLMLIKQGKVYNIQIRKQGNSYSLGTGHNGTQSFPGVKEMITHHTHTPLLLIDATDQSSEAQSQCRLLHPAGL